MKDDTTEILKTVHGHDEQFEELKALISSKKQEVKEQKSDYIQEIEAILKMKRL